MITRNQVYKALKEIDQNTDSFEDQITKAQCRKLARLLSQVVMIKFSLKQFRISLIKQNFTEEFITNIINILSR